jgi:hypothetical protein
MLLLKVSKLQEIPIIQNEPIVDPKQRTAAAASACAKAPRQPVEGHI